MQHIPKKMCVSSCVINYITNPGNKISRNTDRNDERILSWKEH